ncbi:hypothetical protein B0H67DRAFT_588973 [Lasiosphaeris hirsuta]|uniref:Uncharacterized protein n=1 Tax=Lasiosphaeris hirsuta TaxID=260670 RepID=A0AA40A2B3_9PEZI|nr:hypothetical protein B0H67DRAFT_588973 [Lasiosphaeris hirsuta]
MLEMPMNLLLLLSPQDDGRLQTLGWQREPTICSDRYTHTKMSVSASFSEIVLVELDWTSETEDGTPFDLAGRNSALIVSEDEFEDDSSRDSVSLDVTASLTSSARQHSFQHGRRYHTFRPGRYPIPNDEIEQDREDIKHPMMLELTDGKHFLAPVVNPRRIIDLGTSSGV